MNENIKVFLRIKPNVENISHLKDEECASYEINNNQLFLFDKQKGYNDIKEIKTKTFSFNHIFDTHVKQNEIFELVGKTLVDNFINGYNSSILAYGNTNSGKTYTLYGDRINIKEKENKGLIYFCLKYFFNIYKTQKDVDLCVSVVEIYLEKIRDLGKVFELCNQENCDFDLLNFYLNFRESAIREDRKGNTYVENVTLLPVQNIEDVLNIIDLCFKYRRTNATKKNLMSSRSHCLLTVYQYRHHKERQFISQINFIDLAGSEKFTDIEMVNKQELININNTLSVLNRVIMSLSTKNKINKNLENRNKQEINKMNHGNIHIPYRDSKLTRLLKNSLDGNSFTYILICLNIHCYRIEDFINSLIFAKRCKTIKKRIKKNNIKDESDNSNSVCSDSDISFTSYESCDSSCSNLNFLINNNRRDKYRFDNDGFYKKKIKTKNIDQKNDLLNKLTHIFFSILKKKCQDLTKQKNSVINNIIKIVKTEENNKEELQQKKNYFLKIWKEKKKELSKNEKLLSKIINRKNKKKDHVLKKEVSEAIIFETDINKNTKYDIQNEETDNEKVKLKEIILPVLETNKMKLNTNNSYHLEKKNEQIKNIYADIEKLLQLETQKLNQKIHIIENLTFLNISLFGNIQNLTNILKNIYQSKYSVIIKNGQKQLQISNYNYDEIKKLYDKKIINFFPDNIYELDYLKNINKNILTIYETVNKQEAFYKS